MCSRGWNSWAIRSSLRWPRCCSWPSGTACTPATSSASPWSSSSSTWRNRSRSRTHTGVSGREGCCPRPALDRWACLFGSWFEPFYIQYFMIQSNISWPFDFRCTTELSSRSFAGNLISYAIAYSQVHKYWVIDTMLIFLALYTTTMGLKWNKQDVL